MKTLLFAVLNAIVAIPIAATATFLLVPFWRWLEATTGIESIGHSGPAGWSFGVIYTLSVLLGFGIWLWSRRR